MGCLITVHLSGCAIALPPEEGEARHYVIIGIGVVTVSDPANTAVVATSSASLGVVLSDRPGVKLGAGYVSSQVVSVADGAEDVRVDVSRRPGGPLRVRTTNPSQSVSQKTTQEVP